MRSDKIPHNCENHYHDDDLHTICPGRSIFAYIVRGFRGFFLCSHYNRRAITYFRSHACIQFERSRHLMLYPYMIHPFSTFRVLWDLLFALVLMVAVMTNVYLFAFPMESYVMKDRTLLRYVIRIADVLCISDVLLNFITGRTKTEVRHVDLQYQSVARHYLRTYFVLDLIASIPVVPIWKGYVSDQWVPIHVYLYGYLMVTLRLIRSIPYIKYTCEVIGISLVKRMYILFTYCLIYYLHLSACFMIYMAGYIDVGLTDSWYQVSGVSHLKRPIEIYFVSSTRTIYATMGLCSRFYPVTDCDQITTTLQVWIGFLLFQTLVGKRLQIQSARTSSYTKYQAVITQVKQYMASRQIPKHLQRRVIDFYHYSFHRTFYSEKQILRCVSRQLRQDYMFHQCQSLVSKVAFFSELPMHVLTRIVTILQVEFCLAGDTVIKKNTSGTCMYFIRSGTVAVYSDLGKEVCHLEDGQHFGEISLVLAHFRRVASVVTTENCEFYKLERDEFNAVMAAFPDYLRKVRDTAIKRLEKAMRMDSRGFEHLDEYIQANTIYSDDDSN